jgi:ribose transport system substrate-binding protein
VQRTGMLRRLLVTLCAVLLIGVAGVAIGCGSSDSGGDTAATEGAAASTATEDAGASTTASGTADLTALKAKLAEVSKAPAFKHPGPAIDVAPLKGKKFFVIPLAYNTEFNKLQADATVEAGKVAGVNVEVYSTTGTPSQWQQGMTRAISDNAAGIILQGPDPNLLIPQIRQAEAKGIPVVSSHYVDQDSAAETVAKIPNLQVAVPGPFTEASRLLADYVTVQSDGKANVAYVPLTDFGTLQTQMTEAFEAELESVCPDCTVTRADTTFAKVTETPSAITSAIRRNPDIDWIVTAFDLSVPYAQTALTTLGNKDIKVASFNATSAVLKLMQQDGHPLVANIGEPIPVMGYTSLDQAMRLALDEEPVEEPVFMRIFTQDNVDEAGTPPTAVDGYGEAESFVDGYKALWGVG